MNREQRITLRTGAGALVGLLIYPPKFAWAGGDQASFIPAGHGWYWQTSVALPDGRLAQAFGGIDWKLLTAEAAIVLAVTILVCVSFSNNSVASTPTVPPQ